MLGVIRSYQELTGLRPVKLTDKRPTAEVMSDNSMSRGSYIPYRILGLLRRFLQFGAELVKNGTVKIGYYCLIL